MTPHDRMNDETLDAAAAELLQSLPSPAVGAVERVQRRLARSRAEQVSARRAPSPWLVGGLTVALAAASAAIVLRDRTADGTAPVAAGPLDSESEWAGRRLPGVDLTYRGSGEVSGSQAAPHIDWQRGTLNVEVTPDRGLDVRIQTREANIRVLGTGFTVTRDALGTAVEVRHGVVETSCADQAPVSLRQGDEITCLPSSAAGLLGRARALMEAGAGASLVSASLDRGLSLTTLADPIGAELGAMKVEVLAASGDDLAALDAARALITAGGGSRRADVVRFAGELARSEGGCVAVAPWLAEQGPEGEQACNPLPADVPAER
jgi:hypothetical protein